MFKTIKWLLSKSKKKTFGTQKDCSYQSETLIFRLHFKSMEKKKDWNQFKTSLPCPFTWGGGFKKA